VRHDPPQSLQPLRERAANLRGAFSCQRDLTGLRVALVDDVMTSGATLAEAARTARNAGAAFVATIVAARTPRS
jgi:predicted amidophosphoribosyltransferase